ncbi:MAG: hypothetical protein ACP5VE_01865 [Chthonomonadales bacterium]
MGSILGNNRNVLVAILAVAAVALAIWSGYRTFTPKGRTIGHLGNLQETTVKQPGAGNAAQPANSLGQQEATGGLAGAPAGAQPGP